MPEAQAQITLSLPILKKGQHTGEQVVRRLQQMLNEINGANLAQDAIFGPKTEIAVREFQEREALTMDGIVGRQTWTALLRTWLMS